MNKKSKIKYDKSSLKNIGDFDINRMKVALSSKKILIPHNLGVSGIIEFISNPLKKT